MKTEIRTMVSELISAQIEKLAPHKSQKELAAQMGFARPNLFVDDQDRRWSHFVAKWMATQKFLRTSAATVAYDAFRIMSAAFSPIMMVGAFVLAPTNFGMIEASTTRRLFRPWTRNSESTTASSSWPILQVPTG